VAADVPSPRTESGQQPLQTSSGTPDRARDYRTFKGTCHWPTILRASRSLDARRRACHLRYSEPP
jgi:hypothetical protein